MVTGMGEVIAYLLMLSTYWVCVSSLSIILATRRLLLLLEREKERFDGIEIDIASVSAHSLSLGKTGRTA